jgi:hypothetical protein
VQDSLALCVEIQFSSTNHSGDSPSHFVFHDGVLPPTEGVLFFINFASVGINAQKLDGTLYYMSLLLDGCLKTNHKAEKSTA